MTWETKNPPKKTGRYLVTLQTSLGRQVRQADRYEHGGSWLWSILPDGGYSHEVIAWMKCPQPYVGQP